MLASNVIEKNLNELGVMGMDDSTSTVQFVRNMIQNAPRPLELANDILKTFDVEGTEDVISAIIKAQSVILKAKEVVESKRNISAEELNEHATAKIAEMQTMGLVSNAGRKATRSSGEKKGSKRAVATELYLANKDKSLKELAGIIATEMGVSVANARTYIYNVKKALKEI